ncbi:MAG TPA: NADH-quinone oxidoreductase subunit J [Polyangiaceae bacterium]
MTAGVVFFAIMSALSIAGAIVTVGSRNPIRSAVGLLFTIFGIAGLFVQLSAEFMAAIQLIVYAGAVVVLFVFVIMLLGPDARAATPGTPKARASRIFGGVFMIAVAAAAGAAYLGMKPVPTRLRPAPPEYGTVEMVGRELFTRAIVPFELATALLIVAVVGAIAVARSKHRPKPKKTAESPLRMFHGPLIARDAKRPLTKEHA